MIFEHVYDRRGTIFRAPAARGDSVGSRGYDRRRPTVDSRLTVSFGGCRVAAHGGPPALAVSQGDHTPPLRNGATFAHRDHTSTLQHHAPGLSS